MANNSSKSGGCSGLIGSAILLIVVCFLAGMIWQHSGGTPGGLASTISGILTSIANFFKSIFDAGATH